ncbi:hypothetical protein F4803DRAFT_571819 [Xylaria telfairii]|nr:hypothetical protein F4803DRAFT_571819 [Xylaria telfairii]
MMDIIFTIPFLLTLATAYSHIHGPIIVDGSSLISSLDPYSLELVAQAQQHPNATRQVVFDPFGSVKASDGDLEWAWRINVSDFAAPDAEPDPAAGDFEKTVDSHIVTTSYDFNWSGPKAWSTEINGTSTRFCLTVVDTLMDLPANVTNAYTKDDTSSTSCVSTLGQACVDAILATGNFIGDPRNQPCQGPSRGWSSIPECHSTLGYIRTVSHYFDTVTSSRGFGNSSNQTATTAFRNGEGWFGYFSSPQNGSGSNEYYTAMNRLHIAMINTLLAPQGTFDDGFTQNTQLLCMRVNATKLSTVDTNGDGVTLTSEAVLESTGYSVQRTLHRATLAIWSASILFAIIVNTHLP